MKRLSVVVDTDLHREIRIRAALDEISMNDLVVKAVRLYLQQYCENEYKKSNTD